MHIQPDDGTDGEDGEAGGAYDGHGGHGGHGGQSELESVWWLGRWKVAPLRVVSLQPRAASRLNFLPVEQIDTGIG